MSRLGEWLDHRTGYRALRLGLLNERIPGGARWRYVWGSTLVFVFVLQLITGFFLWAAYSASSFTAWESVYYIQHQMEFGWLIRGLHHYGSQVMIVLVLIHLLQVVIAGAYRAPREVNWWLGLCLLFLVLSLSLTGYLLPWDQKGYWATQVATKMVGMMPLLGPALEAILVGGPDYGHHTLTRFFALHAGLLPALVIVLMLAHIALFRRHGVTHPKPARGETTFWPDQALRDSIACAAIFLVLVGLVFWGGSERGFVAGPEAGAELGAPADPSSPYPAARPEWYFLFLFQTLKYFPGGSEIYGAVVVPGLAFLLLALLPFIGRLPRGRVLGGGVTVIILGCALLLTVASIREDQADPFYQRAVQDAQRLARRAVELARADGIPQAGAADLLRRDPFTRGPHLFRDHCAMCHRWDGHDGTGNQVLEARHGVLVPLAASASDLSGFGTAAWIREFLKNPSADRFFGLTKHKNGRMARWAEDNMALMSEKETEAVVSLLAGQAQLSAAGALDTVLNRQALEVFSYGSEQGAQPCSDCHRFEHPEVPPARPGRAPVLTGYASRDWLRGMILDPAHRDYYGVRNDRMPRFEEQLAPRDIELLIDWMRGEWTRGVSPETE